jgi:hypothetical protein
MSGDRMSEHVDHVEDVAKLVRNVAWTESSHIRARHAQVDKHYKTSFCCH